MDRLEFYKSLYEREQLRRETLNNSVSIPIGIISALIAALVYIITNYNYSENIECTCGLFLLVILCVILVFISIYYIARSFNNLLRGNEYKELAIPSKIECYYNELKSYNNNDKEKTDVDFSDYLMKEFIKYADSNTKINDKRSLDLYKSKTFLILAVVVIVFASMPYVYGVCKGPKKKINVSIEKNSDKLKQDSILKYIKMSENKTPRATEKPSRPKPPQGRNVKGSMNDIQRPVTSKREK